MNNTKIDWCDMSWNPVTGCFHKCPYCYAIGIAHRFGDKNGEEGICHYLSLPHKKGVDFDGAINPYPYGFDPTFHRYRLDQPQEKKKPQNIFVGSMADLLGKWVPDEWIHEVLDHCYLAPWHTYLFLTKNPDRYDDVIGYLENGVKNYSTPPCVLFGATAANNNQLWKAYTSAATWISAEPLHEKLNTEECFTETRRGDDIEVPRWLWVVIGAETGDRKDKIIPKREWVEDIVEVCRFWEIPVFMKDSLKGIWGERLIREYPWETSKKQGADHE